MPLPDGWPAPADVETLPLIWLALEGSSWPPATADRPAGVAPAGSWSCERELVSASQAGNVRFRTGLSIGAGSAEIGQVSQDGGEVPLSPWTTDPARRVTSGQAADLYASHDGHDAEARIDLGDWQVAPTSGALLSPGVQIELIERQYAGRVQGNLLPTTFEQVDPAWVVATLARQCGYHSTPAPVASAVVAVPMCGGSSPEVGTLAGVAPASAWDRSTGPLSPVGAFLGLYQWGTTAPVLGETGVSMFATLNVDGMATIAFGDSIMTPACMVAVDVATATLSIANGPIVIPTSGPFVVGDDADHPSRVQLEMQRTYATPGDMTSSTGFRVRARSSAGSAWSAWVTDASADATPVGSTVAFYTASGSSVSAFQLTSVADAGLWEPATADIDPIGGFMVGPWLPSDLDVWAGIQQVCDAHLAATWVSREKVLICRDRNYLAGVGVPYSTLDVGALAADLAWTLDPADTVDRLELTYSRGDVEETNFSVPSGVEAWRASDAIEIAPAQTVNVVADLDAFCNLLGSSAWYPAWGTNPTLVATRPLWSAMPNRDGSGTQPPDTALAISHRSVSVGRAIITITNTTGTTLYTVDANGQPCLILRASRRVGRDNVSTIARGATATVAANVLGVDCTTYVQRPGDAEAIADYLWARLRQPAWKASSVRVKLDWTHDVGDVVRLVHPRSELSVKALVTKVAYDGSPGEVAQSLDLVLLPPTWVDFDSTWAGGTWGDFDTTWAFSSWTDFDLDPLRSE